MAPVAPFGGATKTVLPVTSVALSCDMVSQAQGINVDYALLCHPASLDYTLLHCLAGLNY